MLKLERIDDLLIEADAEINYDGSPPNKINPVLVVLDMNDIEFIDNNVFPNIIQLKKTVTPVLAVVKFGKGDYVNDDGKECYDPIINYYTPCMHNGLRYRIFLAMNTLIGSIGIYPFRKIFKRTTPKSFLDDDISNKPGYNI